MALALVAVGLILGTALVIIQAAPRSSNLSTAPSGSAENGNQFFTVYGCYECHGREGQGAAVSGPRIAPNPIPFEAFAQYVRKPADTMPPYTKKVLADHELADIYAFLQSRPHPPAAQSITLLKLAAENPRAASHMTASPPVGGYHLLKEVPLNAAKGGREYFDYIIVDASARRVYLTHGTEVKVVDADRGKVVGNIPDLKRVHGVALVEALGLGFISDGDDASVVEFDLKTLKVTGKIKTDAGPDNVIYDPASRRIFIFNGQGHDSTVINPENGSVVGTIPIGGIPEQAVADGQGMIYDNIKDTSEVVVIDSRALTIKARWPVAPVRGPVAMAMDREHRRLFIAGRDPNLLVVMDADNGKIIQSLPITGGVDANIYEPETGLLFSSTREGRIHIFHEDSPDKLSVVETVKTEFGAKTMAFDPKTHNLFLDTSDFGPPPPPHRGGAASQCRGYSGDCPPPNIRALSALSRNRTLAAVVRPESIDSSGTDYVHLLLDAPTRERRRLESLGR